MAYQLIGYTFGDLTVLEQATSYNKQRRWKCNCYCGRIIILESRQLKAGLDSCGKCEWHIKHKEAYTSWTGARQRCYDKANKDYPNYGRRGIRMCARWNTFSNFFRDMGDPPTDIYGERKSLDRKNNDGHYEPNNCKWSDRYEQQNNTR